MKCTIIGGGGFIGSHLCEELIGLGHQVDVFERPSAKNLEYVEKLGAHVFVGNFLDANDLQNGIPSCDVIYHLISTTVPKTSNENPIFDIESNVIGTLGLLAEAVKKQVKKVVFLSSGGTVYGIPKMIPIKESHDTNPICSYGISKLSIEKYLGLYHYLYGLNYCILRVANAYGERQPVTGSQGAISVFLSKVINHERIDLWGDGTQIRDYIYIKDIISAMLKAASYNGDQKILNIGTGMGQSLDDILHIIEEIIQAPLEPRYMPCRQFDVPINVLDITSAKMNLNWEPVTSLRDGISRTYQWMVEDINK